MIQLAFLEESRKRLGIVNVASVPQRSPFRYPGGKTWLVPYFRRWMKTLPFKPKVFIEPFCGGGIVGLTVLMENLADRVVLGEADPNVAAVWRILVEGDAEGLANRILDYPISRDRVIKDLAVCSKSDFDRAFQTILRNRVQRGGILAPGASLMKDGENGRGIKSRWYPETLANRIMAIAANRERLTFVEGDAFKLIGKYIGQKRAAFFVDPPYTAGGKRAGRRLYGLNVVDHEALFGMISRIQGRALLTYDDALAVRELARSFNFRIEGIPMKNTHHTPMTELAITGPAI